MGTIPTGLYASNAFSNVASSGIPVSLFGGGTGWVAKAMSCVPLLSNGVGTLLIDDSLEGNDLTVGTFPSGVTLKFTGCGQFGFTSLNVGAFTKLYGKGAVLTMLASNQIGINQVLASPTPLQVNDYFAIQGLRIDAAGLSGTTAISLGSSAVVSLRDVVTSNAAIGFISQGMQFAELYNLKDFNSAIGAKLYPVPALGGGNQINLYGYKKVNGQVGVVIASPNATVTPQNAIYFYDATFNGNSICNVAAFGNENQVDVHFIGGTTERTGGGPASIVVDGNTIPQCSVFANKAAIYVSDFNLADASITPYFIAENGSVVVLEDSQGYGNPTGTMIQCDTTSVSAARGILQINGTIQNALSYPELSTGKIYGAPLIQKNSQVPNAFTGNAQTPPFADILGAASQATAVDPVMGTINTVTFAKSQGSKNGNRAKIGAANSAPLSVISDLQVVIYAMSATSCSIAVGDFNQNTSFATVNLVAGNWTRVVLPASQYAIGASYVVVAYANDATGPTVGFTGLQCTVGPTGSAQFQQLAAQVLQTGAVNTNGN